MKKLVIIALAVFLAMPVLSHAGAVNNRWDMTITGYVGVYGQYADQESAMWGPATSAARRTGTRENQADEYGNFSMQIDPRIGFRVNGPDAWGAKTSAYMEFDFSGMGTGATADNGEAKIRHAWLRFDWANDSILFGNTSILYRDNRVAPPPGAITVTALPGAFGVPRETQLRWEHRFGKNFETKFGLVYPSLEGWKNTGAATDETRSLYPNVAGMLLYTSDACGKIGMSNLRAGISGVYGRKSYQRLAANGGDRTTPYSARQEDGWIGEAFLQVPIIPEKANNKAGALLVWANAMAGQGLTQYSGRTFALPRLRADGDYSKPRTYAWQLGLQAYMSDTVYMAAGYNTMTIQASDRWRSTVGLNAGYITRMDFYNLGLFYTPNPAITLGVEYNRIYNTYAAPGYFGADMTAYKKTGATNAVRFGAIYFF